MKFVVRCALWGAAALLAPVSGAFGGPPYATDDPEPTDYRSFEIYTYSEGTHSDGHTSGTLAGVEVNYGAAPNLQLSAAIPFAFDKGTGRATLYGYGAVELGVKYRFIQEDDDGWRPQVSFYPSAEIPVGDDDRPNGIAGGHTRYFLPLWTQKSFGAWTTFGGGGYWINPGIGDRNYWFMGWALQRQIAPNLSIGTEIFHQTRDTARGESSTGVNIGAIYDIDDRWHLVGSIGTGLQNVRQTDESTYYVAVEWTPSLDGE
ncbi:MAG TPA: hypothetical protein VIM56_05135 [Rhizomicrobium sp.]